MTLKNETGGTIVVKPENTGAQPVSLKNDETYPGPIDGYYNPQNPNELVKVRGSTEFEPFNYVATPTGPAVVFVSGTEPTEPGWFDKILEVVTWTSKPDKDEFVKEHPDWQPTVDAAKKLSAEDSGASSGGGGNEGENQAIADGGGGGWDGSVTAGGGTIFGSGGVSTAGGWHDEPRLESSDDDSEIA